MNLEITKVKKEELRACATISITSWQETYKNIVDKEYLDNLNIERRLEKFENNYQTSPFLVAKINNEVVGFCRYSSNTNYENFPNIDCELTVLYIKPSLKNKGIGTSLFNYAKNELKKEQKHNMLVCCLKGNTIGESFYKKMGGEIIGKNTIEIGNKEYQELAFSFKI